MQVQPHGEVVLEVRVDQLNGPLELVVGQRHFVAGGDGEFAHVMKPVLYIDLGMIRGLKEERGDRRGDIGLHTGGDQQKGHQHP